jgi:hypothetical protein
MAIIVREEAVVIWSKRKKREKASRRDVNVRQERTKARKLAKKQMAQERRVERGYIRLTELYESVNGCPQSKKACLKLLSPTKSASWLSWGKGNKT